MRQVSSLHKAIVLGGTSAHIPLLVKLRKRGFFTLLVDHYDHPVAAPFSDVHYRISTLDAEAVLQLAKEEKVHLVISACVDQANVTACLVGEKLNLPVPYNHETAVKVCDKVMMKEIMQQAGIRTPKSRYLHDLGGLSGIEPVFPLIVKPADGCGSKGVRVARSGEELISFAQMAFNAGRSPKVVVEDFISGREIVFEAFVQDRQVYAVSVYEKFNLYGKETVVQCFRSLRPVNLEEETLHELHSVAKRIVEAFGLHTTPLFIQTMVNDSGVHVIEFGARAAGGLAATATLEATGFDAVEASINAYLGLPTDVSLKPDNGYLFTTNSIYSLPGVFSHVSGQEELLEQGIIDTFLTYKSKGMNIGSDMASSERIAGFIVKGSNTEELNSKTEKALSRLKIWDVHMEEVMIREPFLVAGQSHIGFPEAFSSI